MASAPVVLFVLAGRLFLEGGQLSDAKLFSILQHTQRITVSI